MPRPNDLTADERELWEANMKHLSEKSRKWNDDFGWCLTRIEEIIEALGEIGKRNEILARQKRRQLSTDVLRWQWTAAFELLEKLQRRVGYQKPLNRLRRMTSVADGHSSSAFSRSIR